MSALADLQRAFGAALEDERHTGAAARVRPGGVPAPARIALYRRSVRAQRHDALAATYPVVRRLVGEGFFREMARRYAAAHPSRSGDLHLFGDALGAFLARDRDSRSLPYLPDVARLEWACHECFHAADAPALDAARLAAVPEAQQGALRLRPHPAARLVASPHPVAAIWEANQPDRDGTPEREEGPDRVLVHRMAGSVRLRCVDPAEWELLRALRRGATLEEAVAAMGEGDAERALAPALARCAADGVIAGFTLAPDAA